MKAVTFALALVATPAAALDVYHIATHGDWQVTARVNAAGEVACMADTMNADAEIFGLLITPDQSVSLVILFPHTRGYSFTMTMDVDIEGVGSWRLPDVSARGGQVTFTFDPVEGMEFAHDLQRGSRLSTGLPSNDLVYGVQSLHGSKLAIDDLYTCASRAQGFPT